MSIFRKQLSVFVVSGLAVSLLLMTGCATKSYVRKQVATVDTRVNQLSTTVQENAERLDATDTRARQGLADAGAARNAASAAQASANQANSAAAVAHTAATTAKEAADTANQTAMNVGTRADNRIAALENSIDRYDAGPVTKVMFKVGKSDLSKDAMKALDDVVAPIASQDKGYRVEIQGYTSSEGLERKNINLSQERSESVQRYLVSKGADLIRISVVGLGEENPVADNKTRSGREQNRRAEIRVFSAAK